jgi:hypothetical protein
MIKIYCMMGEKFYDKIYCVMNLLCDDATKLCFSRSIEYCVMKIKDDMMDQLFVTINHTIVLKYSHQDNI